MNRDERQMIAFLWAKKVFGAECMTLDERAKRFFEEAVELAQACGLSQDEVTKIVAHVYSKRRGEIAQELGGVGVTLLTLALAAGLSADLEEWHELCRVVAKPDDQFRKRHNEKAAAGIATFAKKDD